MLSNSWGGGSPSNAITNAINNAVTYGRGGKGAAVIFAAGNTSFRSVGLVGPVVYPANLASVIAVGAINQNGDLTDYTPEGSSLDIVAPSGHYVGLCLGEVVTFDPTGGPGCNDGPGGSVDYTTTFSGTSAAAPQVAATAALKYSIEPALTIAQLRQRLFSGADPWGPAVQFGAGKLNAGRTVGTFTLNVSIEGQFAVPSGAYCTYFAYPQGGQPPYTYQWSGLLSGSDYIVSGVITNGGALRVDVWSADGQAANATVSVSISPSEPECLQ